MPATSLVEANDAIPSHLHPVTLRSTATASSPLAAAASVLAEAQIRAAQSQSDSSPDGQSHSTSSDLSPRESDSGSSSSTSSSFWSSRPGQLAEDVAELSIEPASISPHNSTKTHGLDVNTSRYPSLSSLQTPQAFRPQNVASCQSNSDIYLITCAEYVELYEAYRTSACQPQESVLFPWLHCSDSTGTAQANYFSDNPAASSPPHYRGLTVVSADPDMAPGSLPRSHSDNKMGPRNKGHDRVRTRSIGGSSTTSTNSFESVSSETSSGNNTGSESVATTPTSPSTSVVSFDGPEPRASLLCSSLFPADFLEKCPGSNDFAGCFAAPQLPPVVNLRLFRQQPSRYATVSDIVVYSEAGICDQAIGLAQLICKAQEKCFYSRGGFSRGAIKYNVFIISEPFEVFERHFEHVVAVDGWGYRRNKIDFFEREREEMALLTRASEISHNVWMGNSLDVPLSREDMQPCRDQNMSEEPNVTSAKKDSLTFSICIEAHDQAAVTLSDQFSIIPDVFEGVSVDCNSKSVEKRPRSRVAHLEVPSTGQSLSGPLAQEKLVHGLVEMCAWVKKMSKSCNAGKRSHQVLIHCNDGYTETSLFALSYIMYDRRCSLPEAYLYLQNDKRRSFFVYPADVQVLCKVENRIRQKLFERRTSCGVSRPPHEEQGRSLFFKGRYSIGAASVSSKYCNTHRYATEPINSPLNSNHAWFYDSRFDGHFPSRILPFVYLGNLNHASNALMLKALGITHVVSMGESALIPPGSATVDSSGSTFFGVVNSLWQECANGEIAVLDMKGVADDGIDSIRPHLERAMDFIEQCRLSGGKVLVHCRVGVSRSATIVIAYVMKHLKMDLASAYLMVRSRRLNILIQPNLLFMWALKKLEIDLITQADGEEDLSESIRRKNKILTWSYLSKEIAELNHRYLC
ncbi:hypothetical protein BY996DRAFT_6430991 [Phakopsora pachyrhizi]|uniref:Protein-tyrosine-phosphatase n=1 Tax=Phakopsora pachyrhizi TaxID=170000 RepID=A0AAV0B2X4_PHAPC|nr:hypothetical protein BY996DRAFT_6430991 [Phakopsora pachyrhizi]CAH7678674.1 hypothetical protein PPACK8108_LOCUS13127 [Phakopsora pachyrhizi]